MSSFWSVRWTRTTAGSVEGEREIGWDEGCRQPLNNNQISHRYGNLVPVVCSSLLDVNHPQKALKPRFEAPLFGHSAPVRFISARKLRQDNEQCGSSHKKRGPRVKETFMEDLNLFRYAKSLRPGLDWSYPSIMPSIFREFFPFRLPRDQSFLRILAHCFINHKLAATFELNCRTEVQSS